MKILCSQALLSLVTEQLFVVFIIMPTVTSQVLRITTSQFKIICINKEIHEELDKVINSILIERGITFYNLEIESIPTFSKVGKIGNTV